MRDALNREIQVGDVVTYIQTGSSSGSMWLAFATVEKFTPRGITVRLAGPYSWESGVLRSLFKEHRCLIISRATEEEHMSW